MPDDYARALREWGARKLARPDYVPDVNTVRVDFIWEHEYETFGSYSWAAVQISDKNRTYQIDPDEFDFAKVLQEIMEGT